MTKRPYILFMALAACTGVLHAADEDEVRFRPKAYAPRKSLNDSAYTAAAYAPSEKLRRENTRFDEPRAVHRWNLFKRNTTVTAAKQVHDAELTDAPAYTQQKHISVPTVKADPRDVPEKKPFEAPDKQITNAGYTPAEKPQAKNPLLKPRQGIKEPE